MADAISTCWNSDLDAISTEDWDVEKFIRERLDDRLSTAVSTVPIEFPLSTPMPSI